MEDHRDLLSSNLPDLPTAWLQFGQIYDPPIGVEEDLPTYNLTSLRQNLEDRLSRNTLATAALTYYPQRLSLHNLEVYAIHSFYGALVGKK